MDRKITKHVQGFHTIDGAGVHLFRVLSGATVKKFDPFLMLDSFDSRNPADYRAGFPMHPHRGIETISYVARGKMQHRDTLGFSDTVEDGEVQWMTAGSGILHDEQIPESERLLGVQLWMNLPKKDKMCPPAYHAIKRDTIKEIPLDGGGVLRLLAGKYLDHEGFKGEYLPMDYYDLVLPVGATVTIPSDPEKSAMIFTLQGTAEVSGEEVPEKMAVSLDEGDSVTIHAKAAGTLDEAAQHEPCHFLYMAAPALDEPVAWGGPIVMNTREELHEAFRELDANTFLK